MDFDECIVRLKNAFNNPLPGYAAQQKLAPVHRASTSRYLQRNPAYKIGCVMIILFPVNNQPHVLMIERTPGTHAHAGQIGFPGGKRELDDATLIDTALRETYEETGIDPSSIKILGELTELYIPVSNFLVHPFVGVLEMLHPFVLSTAEVKSVLTPPLGRFIYPQEKNFHEFTSYDGTIIKAPYYAFEQHKIWGASAMMLSELCSLLA